MFIGSTPAVECISTERAQEPAPIIEAETGCDGRSQHEAVRGKTSKLRTPRTRKKCLKILLKQTAKTRQKCQVWNLSWVSRFVRFYFMIRQWNPAKIFRNKNSHRARVFSIKCSDYFIWGQNISKYVHWTFFTPSQRSKKIIQKQHWNQQKVHKRERG